MIDRSPDHAASPRGDLYLLLQELARLEDLLEAMSELGIDSREAAERRLAYLNREVDEQDERSDD